MKKIKTHKQMKQSMWETWFVSSLCIFVAFLIVGVSQGSKQTFPNWPWFALASLINFLYCLYCGLKKR